MDGATTQEAYGKTEEELLKIADEKYKTSAQTIRNASRAADNALDEVTLQTTLTDNAGRQLELDNAKINIQYQKLDALREELRLKGILQAVDNDLLTSDKRGFAAIAEKHTAKGSKITAQQNINTNKQGTN